MKEKSRVFYMILISILLCMAMFFFVGKNKLNSQDYAKNLEDVFNLYNLESNSEHFKKDLEFFGYVEVRENMFEKSYDKYRCEVIKFDNKSLEYYITDGCYSVVGNSIVKDYDNDGNNFVYHVSSYSDISTLSVFDEHKVSLIIYDHKTGRETVIYYDIELTFVDGIMWFINTYNKFINIINSIFF